MVPASQAVQLIPQLQHHRGFSHQCKERPVDGENNCDVLFELLGV